MKKSWIVLIGIIVVLAAAAVYYFYFYNRASASTVSCAGLITTDCNYKNNSQVWNSLMANTAPNDFNRVISLLKAQTNYRAWIDHASYPVLNGKTFGFTVPVRPWWTKYNENDTARGFIFFTDNPACNVDLNPTTMQYNDSQCFGNLAIGIGGDGTTSAAIQWKLSQYKMVVRPYQFSDKITAYVGVNPSLGETDQNIIFSNFKFTNQ